MEKAMRRQFGASSIDIDARQGWVKATFHKPLVFDLDALTKATVGAGYTLRSIEIKTDGTTLQTTANGDTVTQIKVDQTGQILELDQVHQPGRAVEVHGTLAKTASGELRLEVKEITEPTPASAYPDN